MGSKYGSRLASEHSLGDHPFERNGLTEIVAKRFVFAKDLRFFFGFFVQICIQIVFSEFQSKYSIIDLLLFGYRSASVPTEDW
jgi:hypothetical protein